MNSLRFIRNKIYNNNLRIVISFSLYGNINKYIGGLLENCKDINKIYPYFWIYVYLGNDFDRSILNGIFDNIKNIKFIETNRSGHLNSLYRFLPIDNEYVGILFSRDADSRINMRDQWCIRQFINSDKKFNIIRDHKEHGVKILAGTLAIKKGCLDVKLSDLINKLENEYNDFSFGIDQYFLNRYIYELIKNDALIFDEFKLYEDELSFKIDVPYNTLFGKRDFVGNRLMPKNLNEPFGEHGEWYHI
jgi:hypothetical protein